MGKKAHWEAVYETKASTDVSWYQPIPSRSLALLTAAGLSPATTVIDVGGGDSLLVDALLERGVRDVTVLDLSGAALRRAQNRLGARANDVTWLEDDITAAALPDAAYDIWHDRAVFHFLTDPVDRARYIRAATAAVRIGGMLIIATFALDGPTRCSGLEVAQYSPQDIAAAFGDAFTLKRGLADVHRTPAGAEQRFSYAVLQRVWPDGTTHPKPWTVT
jgi:SAM-dependent methyltransferase